MKKLKVKILYKFWHSFFYVGSFLYQIGDRMEGKGIDKMDELNRSYPALTEQSK